MLSHSVCQAPIDAVSEIPWMVPGLNASDVARQGGRHQFRDGRTCTPTRIRIKVVLEWQLSACQGEGIKVSRCIKDFFPSCSNKYLEYHMFGWQWVELVALEGPKSV